MRSRFDAARSRLRRVAGDGVRLVNAIRFHLFFRDRPANGEYCNSKRIRRVRQPVDHADHRPFLAIIRCGASHCVVDDGPRNFDIALNPYARPAEHSLAGCEYVYSGGINKFKAAHQFIDAAVLEKYRGLILLDDDVEVRHSELSRFLEYCCANGFDLAQPSLTADSAHSHPQLLNASRCGWRSVGMVEVMCPYFSTGALRALLPTFDLSYSTWGLDFLWPRILDLEPVVVDEFAVRHTRPVGGTDNAFYRYLAGIGVSPLREANRLKSLTDEQLGAIVNARARER